MVVVAPDPPPEANPPVVDPPEAKPPVVDPELKPPLVLVVVDPPVLVVVDPPVLVVVLELPLEYMADIKRELRVAVPERTL